MHAYKKSFVQIIKAYMKQQQIVYEDISTFPSEKT